MYSILASLQRAARKNGKDINPHVFAATIEPPIRAIAERYRASCIHENLHRHQASTPDAAGILKSFVSNLTNARKALRYMKQPQFRDWLMAIGEAYEELPDVRRLVDQENAEALATSQEGWDTPTFVRSVDIFYRDLAAFDNASETVLSRAKKAFPRKAQVKDCRLTTPAFYDFAASLSVLWAPHTGLAPRFNAYRSDKAPITGKGGAYVQFILAVRDEFKLPIPERGLGFSLCNFLAKKRPDRASPSPQ